MDEELKSTETRQNDFKFCRRMSGVDACICEGKDKPDGAKVRPLTGSFECALDVNNRNGCNRFVTKTE